MVLSEVFLYMKITPDRQTLEINFNVEQQAQDCGKARNLVKKFSQAFLSVLLKVCV